MEVRKVRKVRLFVTNFFLQKWTPGTVGKIGKKGKTEENLLQKLTPGNIGKKDKKGKKGKIVCPKILSLKLDTW